MTIKRLEKKKISKVDLVEEFINKGGKTVQESGLPKTNNSSQLEEIRFSLRIPRKTVSKIDQKRRKEIGNISRNTWILEAIEERLNSSDLK